MSDTAFYCVADERYFLGAVGLINSLRIQGHDQPVFVLDCGLRADQRELLELEATLVAGGDTPPWLSKTVAPLKHPTTVMVLIDVDMIVTRPLDPLIEIAGRDHVVAFENDRQRHVPEWAELLGLGEARLQPYVSSGLVLCGGDNGRHVLELLADKQPLVDFELTFWRRNVRDYPFLYADQDVLNAILTSLEPAVTVALAHHLAPNPPFDKLRLVDRAGLRVVDRAGAEPYVLHQYVRKPWLEPMYHGVYSRLLSRLLLSDDVAISVPEGQVPARMRSGLRSAARRWTVNVVDLGRWHLSERRARSSDGARKAKR